MLRAIVLSAVLAAGVGVGAEPTREVIEKHRDPKIREFVYGLLGAGWPLGSWVASAL